MTPPLKGVAPVDFAVIAAYMALMLGIGFFAMRFNRGASDYFKGGSRIHWLAAGLSSFMSGFSAWTFTGAAGLAYQHGLVAILLYVGNACTFLLGYFLFAAALAARADRHRHGVPGGPLRRADPPGLLLDHDLLPALHGGAPCCTAWPSSWPRPAAGRCRGPSSARGAVILAYCVIGGLWAVVITDFLQAAILMPFTLVMFFASLAKVGGLCAGSWPDCPRR